MSKKLKKLFGGIKSTPKEETEEYTELDLGDYEDALEDSTKMYIRVAELTNINELPDIKKEIYNGNIMIIDISLIKHDNLLLDRIIKDLKQVANDVHGDIAGIGDDQVIVSPGGVKIDRVKVVGGVY
ncbi:MAG TPA: DUF552 domain-containing protein [Methanosarcinales archaeon]|nr:DUF552 domain-containing protein [Methanosarcinales archaeon]